MLVGIKEWKNESDVVYRSLAQAVHLVRPSPPDEDGRRSARKKAAQDEQEASEEEGAIGIRTTMEKGS